MDNPTIFAENLISVGMRATDAADVITQLGELLFAGGHVKATFIPSTIEREKVFATGLPLGEVNVALPHTDPEHVLRPAIAIGCLDTPVPFHVMGSPEDVIQVKLVFLMAIQQNQVMILQALGDTLQHPTFINELLGETTKPGVMTVLNNHFKWEAVLNAPD